MLLASVQPTEKEALQNKKAKFSCALRNVFLKSTQKDTNILIVRPTNCGKSFLLNPIELMFKVFVSPATAWYAWVGLDKCEVADLSDSRHTTEIIAAVTPYFCLSAKRALVMVIEPVCNWYVHTTTKLNSLFCYQQGTDRNHWKISHPLGKKTCHDAFTLEHIQFYTWNRECKKCWPLHLRF